MINVVEHNNILIVGAGASKLLCKHFRTGKELLDDIQNRVLDLYLNPDEKPNLSVFLENKLGYSRFQLEQFHSELLAYRKDREKSNPSIDAFLDEYAIFPEYIKRRQPMIEIGKELITAHVLGWEQKYLEAEKNGEIMHNNWLDYIIEFIAAGKCNNLDIINFNYDRLIEYEIFKSKLFSDIEKIKFCYKHIHHVYGKIGSFEGMKLSERENSHLPFGAKNDERNSAKDYFDTIFDERLYQNLLNVRTLVNARKNIGVLGFGFDQFNLRNIGLDAYHLTGVHYPDKIIHVWIYDNQDEVNIENRRESVKSIRQVYPNIKFHFFSSNEFIREVFK